MPGLHVVFRKDISEREIESASDDLIYKSGVKVSRLLSRDDVSILFSFYDGYPYQLIENDDYLIIIEGMIYNRSDQEIEDDLKEIAEGSLSSADFETGIRKFTDRTDGDFLIIIFQHKRSKAILFNDRWGRLPAFYSVQNGLFTFSRELKFILHWLPVIELDKTIMAQYLIFEYSLGTRTFFRDVRRLPPSTMLKIDRLTMESETMTLLPLDFTIRQTSLPRHEIIDRCVELFRISLNHRIRRLQNFGYSITSDLSAGYDTRTVVAALADSGVEFFACTDNPATGDESAVARLVADHLGVELLSFDASHPADDIDELSRLTYLTDGTINCYTTLTCYYDDLEREKSLTGRQANFMGFGGEFIRHPLKPKSGYIDLFDMIADDAFSSFLRIAQACALLNLDKEELFDDIKQELAGYPEENISDKLKHLFFELHDKQVKGGEDRHRLFRWTVQPLWGKDIFDFEIHNIPLDIIDDDLFIDFMAKVDDRTLDVPVQNKKLALNSPLKRRFYMLERRLVRAIRDNRYFFKPAFSLIRRRNQKRMPRRNWVSLVRPALNILNNDKFISSHFSADEVVGFMRNCRDSREFYQLLTLILYLKEIKERFAAKVKIPD